jgi:hypothetical protein
MSCLCVSAESVVSSKPVTTPPTLSVERVPNTGPKAQQFGSHKFIPALPEGASFAVIVNGLDTR